jgi:hypothetical protein
MIDRQPSCLLKELLKYFILFGTIIECANVSNSDFSKKKITLKELQAT